MQKNRKEAIGLFLKILDKLEKGNKNIKIYEEKLNSLSDVDFDNLMKKMLDREVVLPYYASNLVDKDVTIKNALAVGKELGIKSFQRLWLTDHLTGVKFLTPLAYKVMYSVVRRQSQHVTKGKSVVDSSKYIDSLTGQPAGASKSSRLSLPEIINLDSVGLHKSIEELINVRGGNELGFRLAKRNIINNGKYSLKSIEGLGTRPTSTETLKSFLLGQHFKSNL